MPVRSAGPVRLLRERGSRESAGSNPARQMPDQRPGLPSNSSLSRRKSGRGTLTRGNGSGIHPGRAAHSAHVRALPHDCSGAVRRGRPSPKTADGCRTSLGKGRTTRGGPVRALPPEGPEKQGLRFKPPSSGTNGIGPRPPPRRNSRKKHVPLRRGRKNCTPFRRESRAPAPPEQPKKAHTAPQGA